MDSTSNQHYVYEPLPEVIFEPPPSSENTRRSLAVAHFRLMCLEPGSEDTPLKFHFHVSCARNNADKQLTATADGPDYEAVSYTWQGDKSIRTVSCHNRPFNVSSVVYKMLLHLRRAEGARWLWIDAICIDQTNLRERASQVTIMRLIYNAARRTLVWLGPANPDTNSIVPAIRKMTEVRRRMDLDPGQDPEIRNGDQIHLRELKSKLNLPSSSSEDEQLRALTNLLQHSYFSRIWIIQEIVVSKTVTILQGHTEFSWSEASDAIVLTHQLRMEKGWTEDMLSSVASVSFLQIQRQLYDRGVLGALRKMLNMHRHSKATDPRDKVYALAGISDCWDQCVADLVSYEKPVEDAYRIWTIVILEKENSLDILSAAHRYPRLPRFDTYSWIPDWSFAGHNKVKHLAPSPPNHLQATRGSKLGFSEAAFGDAFRTLILEGYILDRVEAIGMTLSQETVPPLNFRVLWSRSLQQICWMWLSWRSWETIARLRTHSRYNKTGEDMMDAYWQTMSFGEMGYEEDAIRQGQEEFTSWQRHFLRNPPWLDVSFLLWFVCFYVVGQYRFRFHRQQYIRNLAFRSRWTSAAGWRKMIRTETGYIGLASHGIEVGDQVALFRGGRIPLVIRRAASGDEWYLTGDAYIHGVMQGEAWEPEKCSKFRIR